jgi:hypothetical protein
MSAGELRTRIAIADLGERDLNELLSCSARVLGEWRVHGTFTAERRVQVRRLWPELGRALDDLDRGPRL